MPRRMCVIPPIWASALFRRQTAQERFGRNPPSPIKELLALSDAWAPIRGNLENQDSKTALSAQLKLEGIGLFGRMIALRQGMGA